MISPFPAFRTIAIVGDVESALRMFDVASSVAPIVVGVMLRDPSHDVDRVAAIARQVAPMSPENVQLITNSVAIEGVQTLHLPYTERARSIELRGDQLRVGVSIHSIDAARELDMRTDYLIASPIFPTSSKPGHAGIGLPALELIVHAVNQPVFALGGIDRHSALGCLDAGAYGVAGISSFSNHVEARGVIEAVHNYVLTRTG